MFILAAGLFQTPLVPAQIGFHSAAAVIRGAVSGVSPVIPGASSVSSVSVSPASASHLLGSGPASASSVSPPVSLTVSSVLLHDRPVTAASIMSSSSLSAASSSAFPLITSPPGALGLVTSGPRSLSSSSPPLSLTRPPRPPSSPCPSPSPLVVKDLSGERRLLRDRDRDEVRDLALKSDRELRERDRDEACASPPYSHCSGGGDRDYPGGPTSPLQLTPVLVESQIQRIADTAASIVKSLPVAELEPKQPNAKKKICKELEVSKLIISCSDSCQSLTI